MEDDPFGDGGDAQVESTAQADFFGGSNDNPDDNLVAEANFVDDDVDDSEEEESVFDSVPAPIHHKSKSRSPKQYSSNHKNRLHQTWKKTQS